MDKIRYIEEEVRFVAATRKIVLLVGARQVGKSTLLKNLFPNYPVVTFNPHQDVQGARSQPRLFLSQFSGPVILDEIQFAPELLAYLKIAVDDSDANGQFFLTGSQNLHVLKNVAETMAGRVAIIELAPLIPHEIAEAFIQTAEGPTPPHWLAAYLASPETLRQRFAGCIQEMPLTHALWQGGYPALTKMPSRGFSRYFADYLKTYIARDIHGQSDAEGLIKFENFVAIMAALTAKEMNYAELGRELAVHGKTAQRWLGLLRATYIWRDVKPFFGNTIKRIAGRPKGHFIDTGLACYLLNITSPEQLLNSQLFGFLFETYISSMIAAILQSLPFKVVEYHWRSNGGAEVDIVLETGNKLYPIEVKAKSELTKGDARGLKAFRETYAQGPHKVMTGIIVYAGPDCYWVDEGILAVPWNALVA